MSIPQSMYTSQVEKVWILVELVEYCSRAVLDVGSGEDSDCIRWQSFSKLDASIVILLGRDTGCNYVVSVYRNKCSVILTLLSPACSKCGCVS
jgi:hypothetical protein